MNCKTAQRPQTVGPRPMVWQSESILKLLQEIENDSKGINSKPKSPQKNHIKENLKRIREIQAKSKQRIAEKEPLQPLKVPNRLHSPSPKLNGNAMFNGKKSPNEMAELSNCKSLTPRSPYVNRKLYGDQTNLKPCRSLPQLNQDQPTQMKTTHRHCYDKSGEKGAESHCEVQRPLGRIPTYLTERKKQWEQEKEQRLKCMEEASVPSGYTLLPDEERVETLELLKKNQEELLRTLATLPVRNDTMRLRNYKEELERQLAKVEEGIKIFSRPRVLIKDDS